MQALQEPQRNLLQAAKGYVALFSDIWFPLPNPSCSIDTYGAEQSDGTISQGGYASHVRVHDFWVFPIPEKLASEDVAPMLCAGITVFSPLVRNGAGPGKKVGIVGMYVFSPSSNRRIR